MGRTLAFPGTCNAYSIQDWLKAGKSKTYCIAMGHFVGKGDGDSFHGKLRD
jgi:hypothetical protein